MVTGRLRLVPALLVRDMGKTLHFYRTLGFRVTGCHPDESDLLWAGGSTRLCGASVSQGSPACDASDAGILIYVAQTMEYR